MTKMGIIKKLFGKQGASNIASSLLQQPVDCNQNSGINQRLENIYGRNRIEQQMLYEKWIVKESWLLKHEALPLLFGLNPETGIRSLPEQLQNDINQLWDHAKNCVEQGLLKVMNREQNNEEWRATPLDIYRWARISRMELPDAFIMLMEYVSKTIKQPDTRYKSTGADSADDGYIKFDENREKLLGIALALLAAYPEKCRNSRGKVKVDKIVSLINENGSFWLGDEKLELSSTAMRDLIGKWLNTLPASPDINE
jgi:hypothetical protein